MARALSLRRASIAAVVVAATFAGSAKADECLVEHDGVGLGFVVSSRGCQHTVNVDAAFSGLTTNRADFVPRFTTEVSYLRRFNAVRSLHIGPMVALSGTDLFAHGSPLAFVDVSTGARVRYWFGEENPWIFFDGAAGAVFAFPTHGQPPRAGAFLEAGANIHGELGLFLDVEPTFSSADHSGTVQYGVGVKTTVVGVGVILLAYACVQGACHI